MDRRTILAIALIMVVAILPSILFPKKQADRRIGGSADSAAVMQHDSGAVTPEGATLAPPPPSAHPPIRPSVVADSQPDRIVTVESPLYRYRFSTHGARF